MIPMALRSAVGVSPLKRTNRNLRLHVVVTLALFVWQARKLQRRTPLNLNSASVDFFHGHGSWPFHFACSIMWAQFSIAAAAYLFMFPVVLYAKDRVSEKSFLIRMQQMAGVFACVSFISSCHYHTLASHREHRVGCGSWHSEGGSGEPRLAGRYLLWTCLAPFQWLLYINLYTEASWADVVGSMLKAAMCMLLGSAAVLNDDHVVRGESRQSTHARVATVIFFLLACSAFATMLRDIAALKAEPSAALRQRKCFQVLTAVWACYPILHILRSMGFVSVWAEQVLFTSLLDTAAKCVLHMLCWTGPLLQLFTSALGNLSISTSQTDLNLTLDSEYWTILPPAGNLGSMQSRLQHIFGEDYTGKHFLDLIKHDDQQQSVRRAAEQLDKDLNFSVRKLPLDLKLSGDRTGKVDCVISRGLYGQRQIALTLLEADCISTTETASMQMIAPDVSKFSRATTREVYSNEQFESVSNFSARSSSIGPAVPIYRLQGSAHPN